MLLEILDVVLSKKQRLCLRTISSGPKKKRGMAGIVFCLYHTVSYENEFDLELSVHACSSKGGLISI